MQGQLDLGGVAPARATDRLFFALFPDAAAAARIGELAAHETAVHALHGRPIALDRFHLTLAHLGDFAGLPAGEVDAAVAAVARISMPAFEIVLDEVRSFLQRGERKPLVLTATGVQPELSILHRNLLRALTASTGARRHASFVPHVTLAYDRSMISPRTITPLRWMARELALVHSQIGRQRYLILHRHPLN